MEINQTQLGFRFSKADIKVSNKKRPDGVPGRDGWLGRAQE